MTVIKNLEQVYVNSTKAYYEFGNYCFNIQRVNNDVYGNPLYRIELYKDYADITFMLKGLAYKTYTKKGYALIQSYNIADSLKRIFDKIEVKWNEDTQKALKVV